MSAIALVLHIGTACEVFQQMPRLLTPGIECNALLNSIEISLRSIFPVPPTNDVVPVWYLQPAPSTAPVLPSRYPALYTPHQQDLTSCCDSSSPNQFEPEYHPPSRLGFPKEHDTRRTLRYDLAAQQIFDADDATVVRGQHKRTHLRNPERGGISLQVQ